MVLREIRQVGCEDIPLERCIRQSWIKAFMRSPLHMWDQYLAPDRDESSSTAQAMGTAVHCLLLEPEAFDSRYAVAPDVNLSTSAGLDRYAEFLEANVDPVAIAAVAALPPPDRSKQAGKKTWIAMLEPLLTKTVISASDMEIARAMVEAVRKHPLTPYLIPHADAMPETTFVWLDPATGTPMRGQLDYPIKPGRQFANGLILDVKTTRDASYRSFQRDAYNMGYHIQAAVYCDALRAIYHLDEDPLYGWLCVENTRPHGVAYYAATEEQIAAGRREYRSRLPMIRQCMETNTWPGYGSEFVNLGLPVWAAKREE